MKSLLRIGLVMALAAAAALAFQYSPTFRAGVYSIANAVQGPAADPPAGNAHGHGHEDHGPEGVVKLSEDQIARARIELADAGKGLLARRVTVPGTVTPDSDRVARVAAKVVGTVAELHKRLGDSVAKGEIIALLESREVADAKSEYLAARVNHELQKTLFEREQALWEKRISAEQQFLRARTVFTEAELKMNLARQKLAALDLSDAEVAALPQQPLAALRRKEIRAPLAGQVVERKVNLGSPVGGEGQENELYVIADLSAVWLDLSVPLAELPNVRTDQPVTVSSAAGTAQERGRIVFISPMLHAETRSARVIASLDNRAMTWRPGSFVTVQITVEEAEADLVVPRSALQTMAGEQVLFVRTPEGFEKREVVLGRTDDQSAEIVFGLDPGETIAVTNTFVLKADLGKSEADHGHAH
jgi:cobalt-zinc-cadmium efflux system membrane fusion protein